MKKKVLVLMFVLVGLMAQAQVKVVPKLTDGFTAIYVMNTNNTTSEKKYVVSNVTNTDAIITVTELGMSADTTSNGNSVHAAHLNNGIMNGIGIQLRTATDGHILEIFNADDVKASVKEAANRIVNKMLVSNHNPDNLFSEMQQLDRITEHVMEEGFFNKYVNDVVLSLNGKTISEGMTEVVTMLGMKMKRQYTLNAKDIVVTLTPDMGDDELKAYIIQKMEQLMPDNVEMVKANIDMLLPQLKEQFGFTSQSTYELSDDGWVKSVKVESEQSMMGQSSKQEAVITRIK